MCENDFPSPKFYIMLCIIILHHLKRSGVVFQLVMSGCAQKVSVEPLTLGEPPGRKQISAVMFTLITVMFILITVINCIFAV